MEANDETITLSSKRKRKKLRLTKHERYKPKFDPTRKSHTLAVAFDSLSEILSDEEKNLKALIRKTTINKRRSEHEKIIKKMNIKILEKQKVNPFTNTTKNLKIMKR
jgi:hypothetical protein